MDTILLYIKPELVILIIVLYFIGKLFHDSNVKKEYIPIILTLLSIALSALQIISSTDMISLKDILSIIFESITQGIATAGMAVYSNQLIKQNKIIKKNKSKQ